MRSPAFNKESGSFLAAALIIGLCVGFLLVSFAQTMRRTTHENVYFNSLNRVYRLAETGMNDAIGKLAVDPGVLTRDPAGFRQSISYEGNSKEVFYHTAQNSPIVPGGFYIMTNASTFVNGHPFSCRLHSHVKISNAGEYFWAVADDLTLAPGTDAREGKVYANNLTFNTNVAGAVTRVLKAEFKNSMNPPVGDAMYQSGGRVKISDPSTNPLLYQNPKHKAGGIVFPQVLLGDLERYKNLARSPNPGIGHERCDFRAMGDIFPPGYQGGIRAEDPYAGHTEENADHVWYCRGDMLIQGTVHGQVLFVAEGNILITGNLTSEGGASNPPVSGSLPGEGFDLESTAHQAVLITRQNVIIQNGFYTGGGAPQTQTIEAMIMAPHGSLLAATYNNNCDGDTGLDLIHSHLSLNFTGSIIVRSVVNGCDGGTLPYGSFGFIFQIGRNYSYMNSLRTNPPPYLPALAEIHYSFEEITDSFGIFGVNAHPSANPSAVPDGSPDPAESAPNPAESAPNPAGSP